MVLAIIALFIVGGILVSRVVAPEGYPEEVSLWDRSFGDVVSETLIIVLVAVVFYGVWWYLNKRYIAKKKLNQSSSIKE